MRAAVTAEALTDVPAVAEAKAGGIRLAAEQLLRLRRQRVAWRKALRGLLTSGAGRPAGAVLLSLPRLDARLAARILGEVGEAGARFPTPSGLQSYAGTAPVTRASGRGGWSPPASPATDSCGRRCWPGPRARSG